jgi:putative SOS response-associated peptidase YedK
MIERAAFFAQKQEVEEYFGFNTDREQLFEPHYNISPGRMVPVLLEGEGKDRYNFTRLQWGTESGNGNERVAIDKENVQKMLQQDRAVRCVLPLSGFYLWKDADKKGSPFFVRMLNEPVMAIAGLYHQQGDYVVMVTTGSNPLIQPMSEKMPLILNQNYTAKWIDKIQKTDELISEASNLFLLTDLSVLRVSKKVNDPENNGPKLIQPIPK